jgi:CheY-like chemotaxis protein
MANIYKNVLLIDDNEADQLLARKLMQVTGFAQDICIKNSRQSALDYLSNARNHLSEVPDVIFLDINRPAIDGFSFLLAYDGMPAAFKKKCKLVVLSSTDNRHNIDDVYACNSVKAVLPKPLTTDAIMQLAK